MFLIGGQIETRWAILSHVGEDAGDNNTDHHE